MNKRRSFLVLVGPFFLVVILWAQVIRPVAWREIAVEGTAHKRHEHAFVAVGELFYALGGRRIQPVDIYDPVNSRWTHGAPPPIELHHFQALERKGRVVIAGAFTGRFPRETPVADIYYYDPSRDQWSVGPKIPRDRLRGSAGAFLRGNKLYLVSGLTDGHRSGWVPWFDEYDFASDSWRELPDAPRARDHFQAVMVGDQLVMTGGRRSGEGGSVFKPVIKEVDVFDFATGKWRTLASPEGDIPTPRAGTSSLLVNGKVVVIGGESGRRKAHVEVEALDLEDERWESWVDLPQGRHATQPILKKGQIYLQAGSVTQGGTETSSLVRCPVLLWNPVRESSEEGFR